MDVYAKLRAEAERAAASDAAPAHWVINGGSNEARELLSDTKRCDWPGASRELEVSIGHTSVALPFTCAGHGVLWLDDTTLIVSTGTEYGAVLARITAPSTLH